MHPHDELPLVETLRRLDRIPTAPFYETEVLRCVEETVRRILPDDPRVLLRSDRYGNLSVKFTGSTCSASSPVLAYAAHADHPALHVCREHDGRLLGTVRGGLDRELLKGAHVRLHAIGNPAFTAAARIVGEAESSDGSAGFVLEPDRPLGSEETRRITFATPALRPLEISGNLVRAAALDDLAGVGMMLEALEEVAAADLPVVVHLIVHRAEEVGFVGACGAVLEKLVPEDALVYSIEMSSYLARSDDAERVPVATPAAGPVIRTGDRVTPEYDPEALRPLREAALAHPDLAVQERLMWGGACEASLYYAFGYRAAGVCLPLLAAHNNGKLEGLDRFVREGVYLSDLVGGSRLLVALARTVAERPELFRRIASHPLYPRHKELRKRVVSSLEGYRHRGFI